MRNLAVPITLALMLTACVSPPTPTLGVALKPSESATGMPDTVAAPSLPTQYLEFADLGDLQRLAKFHVWVPAYIPGNLPFYKAWLADYANGDESVRLLYCEPGPPRDANLKSVDIQMTESDQIVSSDSITHQSKATALDIRQVQVRSQTGFAYWTRSGAAGNSAVLVWREGRFNFSVALFGAWPQPDESNPHGLDTMLLAIANSLQAGK